MKILRIIPAIIISIALLVTSIGVALADTSTLTSITVTPTTPESLTVGSTQQFVATGTYSDTSSADITSQVTWASSDPTKATISTSGLATGVAAGATTITASLGTTISPAVTLTVIAPEVEYQGLVGTITNITGDVIKLETKARGEVEVTLNGDTTYKIPSEKEATQAQVIIEGKRVAILATEEAGVYVAKRVMLISDDAIRCHIRHITGVVSAVDATAKTMTITVGKKEISMNIDAGVAANPPKVSDVVIASVKECPDDTPLCVGIRTLNQVRDRLRNHLADVIANRVENRIEKEKNIENLNRWLERLGERHQQLLEKALESSANIEDTEVRTAVHDAIENAIQNATENHPMITQKPGGNNH